MLLTIHSVNRLIMKWLKIGKEWEVLDNAIPMDCKSIDSQSVEGAWVGAYCPLDNKGVCNCV